MKPEELQHHGIKGMRWGVRRYQNEDGSLTSAGQKRYARNLSTLAKRDYDASHPYLKSPQFEDAVKTGLDKTNALTQADKKLLSTSREKYMNSMSEYFNNDYYYSDAYKKDSAKAYDDTLAYYRKSKPDYLDEITKLNNGDTSGLEQFHDFRKTLDGFYDEAWSRGKEKWDKMHDMSKLEKQYLDAKKNYFDQCENVGEKLVGKYGDTRASIGKASPTLNDDIVRVVDSVISEEASARMKGARK